MVLVCLGVVEVGNGQLVVVAAAASVCAPGAQPEQIGVTFFQTSRAHTDNPAHPPSAGAGAQCRFDYIARFGVAVPVLNFTALWAPAGQEDGSGSGGGEEGGAAGAVELFCVQTTAVQLYKLDPELCRPGGCRLLG